MGGANRSAAVADLPPDVAAYREEYLDATSRRAWSASALAAAAATSGGVLPSGTLALASRLAATVGLGRWRRGLADGLDATVVTAADPPAVVLVPSATQSVSTVRGSPSSFLLELDGDLPPAEFRAIIRSVHLWAEEWPSSGTLRVQVLWPSLDPNALDATSTPRIMKGGC